MTNLTLAQSYLVKATARLKILPVLMEADAYSDVIREAQELVELALKGMLRQVGVEPPKWHDVGPILTDHESRFLLVVREAIPQLVSISAWLRKEREFAFYGDEDFIPTSEYKLEDAQRAMADAEFTVKMARLAIPQQ